MKKVLHCFHGFLGLPSDWDILELSKFEIVTWSIWDYLQGEETRNWKNLSEKLFKAFEQYQGRENYLLAYSFGGRICLELLAQKPTFFKKVVMVSVNPGLKDRIKKIERREADNNWADLFLSLDWKELMERWNQQAVFSPKKLKLDRKEKSFKRESLAKGLRHFSLGYQEDYRPILREIRIPLLWVVGEDDSKYLDLCEELQQANLPLEFWVCEDASHRVPWEQTEKFNEKLKEFLIS